MLQVETFAPMTNNKVEWNTGKVHQKKLLKHLFQVINNFVFQKETQKRQIVSK